MYIWSSMIGAIVHVRCEELTYETRGGSANEDILAQCTRSYGEMKMFWVCQQFLHDEK